jgi:hypothetical protein
MVKENSGRIYFIMGKNNDFDVITGWDGRDEALKSGWVFPKYNMRLHKYVTNYDRFDMDIVD